MTKARERWIDEIFRGEKEGAARYIQLGPRELPLVTVAILDLALTEMLERRLRDDHSEVSAFLGTNGDGRAPAASVGAKVQLGYLLGILSADEARLLRVLKNIRNLFAHRVALDFLSPATVKELKALDRAWCVVMGYRGPVFPEIGTEEAPARVLIMAVGLSLEVRFHERLAAIVRLEAGA